MVQGGGYKNRTLSKKSTIKTQNNQKQGTFVGPFLDIEILYVASICMRPFLVMDWPFFLTHLNKSALFLIILGSIVDFFDNVLLLYPPPCTMLLCRT